VELSKRACDGGVLTACRNLGVWSAKGLYGQKMDYRAARLQFEKACNDETSVGCGPLASLYDDARGVPRDYPKALSLAGRGCSAGDAESCLALSRFHRWGHGTPASPTEEAAWLKKACDLGSARACADLKKK